MNEFDKTASALLALTTVTSLIAAAMLVFTGRELSALVAVVCAFAAIWMVMRIAERARTDEYMRRHENLPSGSMDMELAAIYDPPTFGQRITEPFRRRGDDAA